MAHLNGHIFLTPGQVKKLAKGKTIRFRREGKWIVLGMKNDKEAKIKARINRLRNELLRLKKGLKDEPAKPTKQALF